MYTDGTERNIIFTNRKFVAIYVRINLQEKTEFLQDHQFWLGRLSIPLG